MSNPVVNGIETETGYRGYDAWWWGLGDAVLEALTAYSIKGVVRLTNRLAHFTEYRHTPEECRVTYADGRTRRVDYCEWWVEDVDRAIDKLNAVTSEDAIWHIEDGGLYLSPDCGYDPLGDGNPPSPCNREDCYHHMREG